MAFLLGDEPGARHTSGPLPDAPRAYRSRALLVRSPRVAVNPASSREPADARAPTLTPLG